MLRLEHISKTYPTGEVLKDVNWELTQGQRVGLVGANGAGKSTQLRIIMGEEEPSSGEIIRPSQLHIAYLTQEFDVDPERTVRDELWTVFERANALQHSMLEVQEQMQQADPDALDRLIHRLDRLQREFEAMDGYGLEAQIEKILPEVGFEPSAGDQLVGSFSGGWQMRISLAKILLQDPDVLLLDEPTNHLDIATVEWLEGYLKGLTTPMVVISHDREFLDRLCTQIVETERGVTTTYLGNYTQYVEQKQELKAAQLSAYERQEKEIAKQQAFVERFRASATRSTQAKSREKQLDKRERIEAPIGNIKTLAFRFPPAPRSGREVALIEDMTHIYDDKILFLGASLLIERGDRIAILGPNGAGKSTLLRLIMGIESPEDGAAKLGDHNVIPGYFEQNQAEALELDRTVLDTIHDEVPDWLDRDVRSLLGQFLFSQDTVQKQVRSLSGGEKARLALAKMLLQPTNLLLLDEPTNHLDISAKEMLEEAIQHYDGSVVVVSHDRYFISKIATKIVEIKDGDFRIYRGGYQYYLDKLAEERERARLEAIEAQKAQKAAAKREKQRRKKAAKK
ncbi:MAG: ABC-F family ATP-binding cassette domain-containing protein [Cyanobacteria bacterium P01_A01_bin.135]